MNTFVNQAIIYTKNNIDSFIKNLMELLRIKTISTDSNHQSEMIRGANWIADYIRSIGSSEAFLLETLKYPVVYGNISKAGPDKPTVLIYGHYDVQPPDPLEQWKFDPFEPTIMNGSLYARGASDMKGQLMVIFAALKSIHETSELPINIKFIIEGEEEIGSPNIRGFLKEHKELFSSDFVLNLDAGMISRDKPTIVYGLRGLAYFELEITGPRQDLHSGVFGGVVFNPIQALAEIIAGMKDKSGVIQLPDFYDDVIPLGVDERDAFEKLGMDEKFYLKQTGAKKLWGEEGFSPVEQVGARPSLDVHGIQGGYTGEGPKTVIPAKAMAKISMRLVPNQTPENVHLQLKKFLDEKVPEQVSWKLNKLASDPACLADIDFYGNRCFAESIHQVWGVHPVYQRGGGSIPIVSHMQEILNLESVLSGFSLPEDNIHSPNEKLDIDIFSKGVETVIHFFFNLSETCKE